MPSKSSILPTFFAILASASFAHADLAGFSGFQTNNAASVDGTNTDLTITTRLNNEANTAFNLTKQAYTNGFTASFTYNVVSASGGGPADGFSFIIQNNSPTAVGGGAGGAGYDGIPTSAAVIGRNWPNGTPPSNTHYATSGGTNTAPLSTAPVNFDLVNNPVNETLVYDPTTGGGQITETLVQGPNSFSTIFPASDLASSVTGTTAYIGFGGGTGGENAQVDITNFTYKANAVPEPSTWLAAGGLLLLAAGDFRRRLKA